MSSESKKLYLTKENLKTLKQDISLVDVIGSEEKLMQKGDRFFVRCPKHEDTGYSVVINPDKNLWYCFGECKKGGSIVDWIMLKENATLIESLAILAERYPFLAQKGQIGKLGLNETVPEQGTFRHQTTLLQIVEYYNKNLLKKSRAIRYLLSFGINKNLIKKHKIGFCSGEISASLIKNPNEVLREELMENGLLLPYPDKIEERFRKQIVFPLLNEQGNCLQIFGRKLPKKVKANHLQLIAS